MPAECRTFYGHMAAVIAAICQRPVNDELGCILQMVCSTHQLGLPAKEQLDTAMDDQNAAAAMQGMICQATGPAAAETVAKELCPAGQIAGTALPSSEMSSQQQALLLHTRHVAVHSGDGVSAQLIHCS